MNTHTGPWLRVGVPANMLERWRHGASDRLRPAPQMPRLDVPRRPEFGGFMSAEKLARTNMARRSGFKRKRGLRRRRRYGRVGRRLQPYSMSRWLKTSMYFALNAGGGTLTEQTVNLNNAYDPMGSASAQAQPLGWDQYTALYQRCTVVAWRVKIEAVSTDNTNALVIGFTPSRSSTALTSYNHYRELPSTVQRLMTPDIDKVIMGMKGSVKRWLAPPGSKILSVEELAGTATTGPARNLFAHVYAQALDESADPASVGIILTLQQLCVFHEPVVPARSLQ